MQSDKEIIEFGVKCLNDEASALLDLIPKLDENFAQAVKYIFESKGRVIVTGVGKSGHIGEKIAATFASTGTPSFFVNPLDAYHGDLGMFTSNDVVIAISYSGQTDELLRFIPILLNKGITIIGMTGNPDSLLARYSTCHLNVSVKREACPLNLAPTSSTTCTLALGDALACALIKVRDFKAEDFARFHPGGSLGKRLLAHVSDYMQTTNLPIAKIDDKLTDTLLIISEGKFGLAVVTDDDSNVLGLITDGDIRRAMQKFNAEFFNLSVKDIINRNPLAISCSAKLQEAENLMNSRRIRSLLVTDDENRFVGIIDKFNIN